MANPSKWLTHWPGDFDAWTEGIGCYDQLKLKNNNKLPIGLLNGNCLSQCNVTLLATLKNEPYMNTHGLPIPECLSWWMTRKLNGGAIATIGSTAASYVMMGNKYNDPDGDGIDEPDCVEEYSGYLIRSFFETYNNSVDILGETWGETINKFIDTWPTNFDQVDSKTVQEWILFGDPSLKIGGY